MSEPIDLGHGHSLRWIGWYPDRDLNPQYDGIPDIEKCTAVVSHARADGQPCEAAIHPDTPEIRRLLPEASIWKVESWEPLTLSPSILCMRCQDHGFIREGRWVPA